MNKNSAYELAVWQAKATPDQNHNLIVDQTNQVLSSLSGFKNRTIFQSISDPLLLFDWVEWDNTTNAKSAAEQMMSIPQLQAFVSLIDKTLVFEHYRLSSTHQSTDSDDASVELVVYRLSPDANSLQFQRQYSSYLSSQDGYLGRYIFQNTNGGNRWAELVYWQSKEKAADVAIAMSTIPEMTKLLQQVVETPMLHQYFRNFV